MGGVERGCDGRGVGIEVLPLLSDEGGWVDEGLEENGKEVVLEAFDERTTVSTA